MGTGKSRAARILADGLDWQLADTDRMMEKDTGMRIAEYYQSAGPDAFTAKEKEIINRVRFYHEAVIAMGGNYPMTEEKFHLLSEHGVVILLYAKPFRLAERVRPHRETSDDGLLRCGRIRPSDAEEMDEMERQGRSCHQYDELPSGTDSAHDCALH